MYLAHLLRDAAYATEDGDTVFAPGFRRLLLRAVAIGKRRDELKDTTLAQCHADLDRRLSGLPSGPALTQKAARRLFRAIHQQCLRAGAAAVGDLPQSDELLPRQVEYPSLRCAGERDGHRTIAWASRTPSPPRCARRRAHYAIRVITGWR
jgi:hypothetical protein